MSKKIWNFFLNEQKRKCIFSQNEMKQIYLLLHYILNLLFEMNEKKTM